MDSNLPISEIMQVDLITVEVTDTFKDVANVFENIKIRHVPVLAEVTLVGMISKSDVSRMRQFCQLVEGGDAEMLAALEAKSVRVLMKKPITIQKNDSIAKAAEIMTANHFHALPVMDDLKLAGIVTSTDIMKLVMKG